MTSSEDNAHPAGQFTKLHTPRRLPTMSNQPPLVPNPGKTTSVNICISRSFRTDIYELANAVGTVAGYGTHGREESSSPDRGKTFLPSTSSAAHPASYLKAILSPGTKLTIDDHLALRSRTPFHGVALRANSMITFQY
jgi:hypothetical protein